MKAIKKPAGEFQYNVDIMNETLAIVTNNLSANEQFNLFMITKDILIMNEQLIVKKTTWKT